VKITVEEDHWKSASSLRTKNMHHRIMQVSLTYIMPFLLDKRAEVFHLIIKFDKKKIYSGEVGVRFFLLNKIPLVTKGELLSVQCKQYFAKSIRHQSTELHTKLSFKFLIDQLYKTLVANFQ
jgi:hypothetical protein